MKLKHRSMSVSCWLALALLALPLANGRAMSNDSAGEEKETRVGHLAKGTFEIEITPQEQDDATGVGRMSLVKRFAGQFTGKSSGTMLTSIGDPKTSATYVAIERVVGELDGHTGSFVLAHKATMTATGQYSEIIIAPDTGTEELKGISGSCVIEIRDHQHYYTFKYSLPE